MTWLSIALIAVGLADLVRARGASGASRRARVAPAVAVGLLAIALLLLVSDLTRLGDVLAGVGTAGGLVAWIRTSERTQSTGQRAGIPLAVLGGLMVALVVCSGWASDARGPLLSWLRWADLPDATGPISVDRALIVAAVVLFNVATANVVVRLVLLAIGALRSDQVVAASTATTDPEPADRLKGGRLLGPMERLLIIGLGLAGEFGAAGIVIAAKGLLRFPEIQAASKALPATPTAGGALPGGSTMPRARSGPVGIDDVTEYFLIGSFVSWLLALGSLALATLG